MSTCPDKRVDIDIIQGVLGGPKKQVPLHVQSVCVPGPI